MFLKKRDIDISGNGLEHIPEELFKLRHLTKVNAGFNLITEWDDVPIQLETLILNNNKILDMTGYVTQMTCLQYLDLSSNIIPTVIPLNKVPTLRYLFLRNNKVYIW